MGQSSSLKSELLSVVWLFNWSCYGTTLHTEKCSKYSGFLQVLCMFDCHNTDNVLIHYAANKHSPDGGRTAMDNLKLLSPKGRYLSAVAPLVGKCSMTEGTQCSGNMLTSQLGYLILFITYSVSTSERYGY